jgi:hypothetical protein
MDPIAESVKGQRYCFGFLDHHTRILQAYRMGHLNSGECNSLLPFNPRTVDSLFYLPTLLLRTNLGDDTQLKMPSQARQGFPQIPR